MPRLPSAGDVPSVTPSGDPGLNVPAEAFASPLGTAAKELAPAAEKFAEVQVRQQNRRDAVASASMVNQHNRELDEEIRRRNVEEDLSDDEVLAGLGSFIEQRRQSMLASFTGSEDARARLAVRFQDIGDAATGRASGISVKLGREKVDKAYNDRLTPLGELAAQDPTPQNLNRVLNDVDIALDDLSGAFDPSEEEVQRKIGQEHVVLSAVDRLLILGRTDEAESLLIDGGMNQFLSTEKQRSIRRSIETTRFNEGSMLRKIQQAEAALGRRLTVDERAQLIGLDVGGAIPSTKEVFNLSTGQLQFATDEQIAVDPNLVPKEVGKAEEVKLTASQRQAASFALRTEQAGLVIDEVGEKFTGLEARIAGGGFFPQGLKSEDRQLFEQAERNFVNAILRRESGAAIAPSEFESAEQQYFPRPGDGEAVLAQKQQNRIAVTEALKLEAEEAFTQLKAAVPETVKVNGKNVLVGSIVTNSKGQKGRVEQDGSITVLEE